MKLSRFNWEGSLDGLRKEMGASEVGWDSGTQIRRLSHDEWARLSSVGVDIPISQLEYPEDGTLQWRGEKVVVYIRDQYSEFWEGGKAGYKFHVSFCETLEGYKIKGKYDRYVVTNRKDGDFLINLVSLNGKKIIKKEEVRPLKVCMHCLKRLDYDGFLAHAKSVQFNLRDNFRLAEFFLKYTIPLLPTPQFSDGNQPLNVYTEDWPEISKRIRRLRGSKCEKCPEKNPRTLQVHHRNSQKSDNRDENLQVLCRSCHDKAHL